MENFENIDEKTLEKVTAGLGTMGMKNPVAGMPKSQALEIAAKLGNGIDDNGVTTMSGEQFMKWWEESNNIKR